MSRWTMIYNNKEDYDDQLYVCTWVEPTGERRYSLSNYEPDDLVWIDEVVMPAEGALAFAMQLPEVKRLLDAAKKAEEFLNLSVRAHRDRDLPAYHAMQVKEKVRNALVPFRKVTGE